MGKGADKAGIEVIVDVVFITPTKATSSGLTQSFRASDNRTFYLLDPSIPARYLNYSGTGNTVNANHPIRRRSSSTACGTG